MATVQEIARRIVNESSPTQPVYSWEDLQQKSKKPTRKISSVALGGALSTIVIWAAGYVKVEVDQATAAAIVTVVSTLLGYLAKDKKKR